MVITLLTLATGRRSSAFFSKMTCPVEASQRIALGLVKVHLRDHIILTESEYFSMREANRLPFYDFQTGEMLRPY